METVMFSPREIEVTSVFFSKNEERLRFQSYPRRLIYKGREYILADT